MAVCGLTLSALPCPHLCDMLLQCTIRVCTSLASQGFRRTALGTCKLLEPQAQR